MRTSEEMFPIVEDWLESGLTQKEYSRQHQLAKHILPYWVGRYRMNQAMEFFSDGADNLMNLQRYLNPLSEHYLDWFHITIRSETGALQD